MSTLVHEELSCYVFYQVGRNRIFSVQIFAAVIGPFGLNSICRTELLGTAIISSFWSYAGNASVSFKLGSLRKCQWL